MDRLLSSLPVTLLLTTLPACEVPPAAEPGGARPEPPAAPLAPVEETTVDVPPPASPPQRMPPRPSAPEDYFFRPGSWHRQGGQWAWEPQRWERKQAGRFWLRPVWNQRGPRWVRLGGEWKEELPVCAPPAPKAVKMVPIPATTFTMGNDAGGKSEAPAHAVSVAAFSIDQTEVTMAAYAACVQAGKCTEPRAGGFCTWQKCGRADHPINCVDHKQATAYCAFAGKRLPTEAEWELAARGTDGRLRSWDSKAPGARSCSERYGAGTCPVGAHPADVSPFGLLDIADNVNEWTSSPACSYSGECVKGPPGLDGFIVRVPGGWGDPTVGGAATARLDTWQEATSEYIGFRCAATGHGG